MSSRRGNSPSASIDESDEIHRKNGIIYHLLEGEGIFLGDDGHRVKVGPGDVCTILAGECHAIENASEYKDFVFMALIHYA